MCETAWSALTGIFETVERVLTHTSDAIPPHAGRRGMRVQRCHSRPARPAHTVPCSRRAPSTARLSTARHRLVEAPACSASPQPAGRERARRAHAQSCSSRATACPSLEYLLWTDPPSPGCAASLASRRPALGHTSATLQPHTAPAQQPAVPSAFVPMLPPTPPGPCHTLGPPLCARCGCDPRSVVTFGLLP